MPTNTGNPQLRSVLPASIVGAIAAIVLAACQPTPRPDVASPVPINPHAAKSGTALIHAQATYLERILLSPGATLDVQLIEDGPDAAHTRMLVTQHATDLRGPPFAFDVAYDPAMIQAGARYGLRASLRDSEGRLLFATAALVPVVPGTEARVEFRLIRADQRQ